MYKSAKHMCNGINAILNGTHEPDHNFDRALIYVYNKYMYVLICNQNAVPTTQKIRDAPVSAPGLPCVQHVTQACALTHATHLSPPQVDCPLSSSPKQDWPPFKGVGPNILLSTTLTSTLMDSWVLDSIACLVNKGLVVPTLAFCILCSAPLGHRHFTG